MNDFQQEESPSLYQSPTVRSPNRKALAAIELSGSEEHGSPFGCKGPSPLSNETTNSNHELRPRSPTKLDTFLDDREDSLTQIRFTDQAALTTSSTFGLGLRLQLTSTLPEEHEDFKKNEQIEPANLEQVSQEEANYPQQEIEPKEIEHSSPQKQQQHRASDKEIEEDNPLEFEVQCPDSPTRKPRQIVKQPQQQQEELKVEVQQEMPRQKRGVSIEDFVLLEEIGSGSFGMVRLVQKEGKKYALKELSQQRVSELGKSENVFRERNYMNELEHPAFPKLYSTFMDEINLYFLLEHVPNGSLYSLLRQQDNESIPDKLCRFYAAWLVLALEYMHSKKIVHRDLKPQNILVDEDLYLKIIDFGEAKLIENEEEQFEEYFSRGGRSDSIFSDSGSLFGNLREEETKQQDVQKLREGTFVGTPLYVAPEMLEGNFAGKFTDLWALGCIIYQFHVGETPFSAKRQDQVFMNIKERKLNFPKGLDQDTQDLIDSLLDLRPFSRLGMQTYDEIKSHSYFKGINFEDLKEKKLKVPCQEIFTGRANKQQPQAHPLMTSDSTYFESTATLFEGSHGDFSDVQNYALQHYFDPCCQGKIDGNQIVMESYVNVRRKLFFYKRRQMYLMENGTIYIVKKGHINNELKLSNRSVVSVVCDSTNCKILIDTPSNYEYIECDTTELASTWHNILLSVRRMVIEGLTSQTETVKQHKAKHSMKSGREMPKGSLTSRSSQINKKKVIEAQMNVK